MLPAFKLQNTLIILQGHSEALQMLLYTG